MIKITLEKMQYLRGEKLRHLVRFLKSDGLSLISDDIATVDKKR